MIDGDVHQQGQRDGQLCSQSWPVCKFVYVDEVRKIKGKLSCLTSCCLPRPFVHTTAATSGYPPSH